MMSRAIYRRVAGTVLGVLLFAQAALAAACDGLRMTPALAFAGQLAEPSCHEQPVRNANLCLADCLSFDQSADTPQLAALAPSLAPVLSVAVPERALRTARDERAPASFAAPPPRILFQSFLI